MNRVALLSSLLVALFSVHDVTAAERRLLSGYGLEVFLPDGGFCRPQMQLAVRSADSAAFRGDRINLQKLIGGSRAVLEGECPSVQDILITGEAGGRTVYQGSASRQNNWVLVERIPARIAPDRVSSTSNRSATTNGHGAARETQPQGRPLTRAEINDLDRDGYTLLHRMAMKGNADLAQQFIAQGADVNVRDTTGGNTALHLAARNGDPAIVEVMLNANADINALDKLKKTPVQWAALKGHTDAVNLLIRSGANIETRDINNNSPLTDAMSEGHTEVVKLLIDAGARFDASGYNKSGYTVLHTEIMKGDTKSVNGLIAAGADVMVRAKDDAANEATPLHFAAFFGHTEIIKSLIKAGADVNAKNANGVTPLHDAAMNGQAEATKTLLAAGANRMTKDSFGNTALDIASKRGHSGVVDILKSQ